MNETFRKCKCICSDFSESPKVRFSALKTLAEIDNVEAQDMIIRAMDSLAYLSGKEFSLNIEFLKLLTESDMVPGFYRMSIAVFFYNMALIEICYDCFDRIMRDENEELLYRIEACKFVMTSEINSYTKTAKKIIEEYVRNLEVCSEKRSDLIFSLSCKRGIKNYFNSQLLRIRADTEFCVRLHKLFYKERGNEKYYRLISAQYLLSNDIDIEEELLEMMRLSEDEKDISVIADMLLRCSKKEHIKKEASDKIKSMERNEANIYKNYQNVHDTKISDSVRDVLENLRKNYGGNIDYYGMIDTISSRIDGSQKSERDKFLAKKALKRIDKDTSVFTENKYGLSDILTWVWYSICTSDNSDLLRDRLIEELVDMCEWCSSGYATRLVNVFTGIDKGITISWREQIKANVDGRVEKAIKENPDRENLILGMLEGETREKYLEYMRGLLTSLKEEMATEFSPYISQKEFEEYFEEASGRYL